jgi:hypothetical protein
VEARRDDRQHQVAVLDRSNFADPAQALRRANQQPVVRTDEDVAAGDLDRDSQPVRADARVDHRDVDPDRHVRQGEDQ